ncbi:MAG: 3-oxoacyl-ACP synthase [Bacteroidetes bacterium]|nr:3-oxoacyl-ACP synthase [Bacteroidota bacterium]
MKEPYLITGWCIIRKDRIVRNDKVESVTENFVNFAAFIKALYKKETVSYPKFYKMDNLSKLGFLAAELLFKENTFLDRYDRKEIGIVIMNSSSSLDTDLAYNETIKDRSNYFPSPSVFVYTLPNILIGEICIRNKINGENAFLVSEKFDPERIIDGVELIMDKERAQACLCGWVEVLADRFEALLFFVGKENRLKEQGVQDGFVPFTSEHLVNFYENK